MSKILRYNLRTDRNTALPCNPLMMPPNSTILSAAMQIEGLNIWALAPNPTLAPTEPHYPFLVQTGKNVPDWIGDCRFIATIQYFNLSEPTKVKVDHLFELSENEAKAISLANNIAV